MEVLAIWIIITELPNIKMIVTFTKRVQNNTVNHCVIMAQLIETHTLFRITPSTLVPR